MSRALKIWNKENFGHIQSSILFLNQKLSQIQSEDPLETSMSQEEHLKMALTEQLKREEILWKQKSRLQWLTTTDLNTKFFHMTSTMRRRRNNISHLKNSSNQWINDPAVINSMILDHFKGIYQSTQPSFPPDLEQLFPQKILLLKMISSVESLKKKKS